MMKWIYRGRKNGPDNETISLSLSLLLGSKKTFIKNSTLEKINGSKFIAVAILV
jgi:hypothetical protein